jgi:hypothetical protein
VLTNLGEILDTGSSLTNNGIIPSPIKDCLLKNRVTYFAHRFSTLRAIRVDPVSVRTKWFIPVVKENSIAGCTFLYSLSSSMLEALAMSFNNLEGIN